VDVLSLDHHLHQDLGETTRDYTSIISFTW
jgi:hypothetical protein